MQQSLRDDETASGFGFNSFSLIGDIFLILDVGDKVLVTCRMLHANLGRKVISNILAGTSQIGVNIEKLRTH